MIAGKVYVKADGESIFVGNSVKYGVADATRSSETGLSGYAGTSEEVKVPYVEFESIALENTDVKAYEKIVGATILLKLANGKNYLYPNASKVGDTDWNEKSRGTIRFEGPECRQV